VVDYKLPPAGLASQPSPREQDIVDESLREFAELQSRRHTFAAHFEEIAELFNDGVDRSGLPLGFLALHEIKQRLHRRFQAARAAHTRALERLRQERADLKRLLNDSGVPLPVAVDGQLNIARTELATAEAALEKLMIRAPINGSVLQINGKIGELASPSATQPLIVLGDVSGLRVRAEVDERDFGDIKIGQPALVRTSAFRGREIAGKVSSIAPIVDAGRINLRGQRNMTDVNVVEVVIDLTDPGPLAVGMKVDVYFRLEGQ